MVDQISVLTNNGKMLTVKPGDDIEALVKNGTITKEQGKAIGQMLKPANQDLEQGVTIQEGTKGTEQDRAARANAHQKLVDEAAQMKAQAQNVLDEFQSKRDNIAATDTDVLSGQEKYTTKEGAQEEFGVTGLKNRKIRRAAKGNLEAMDRYDAVEKIFTNEDEYKAAVKKAKADGTWDKDNPKYTLRDGKALDGARTLYEKS